MVGAKGKTKGLFCVRCGNEVRNGGHSKEGGSGEELGGVDEAVAKQALVGRCETIDCNGTVGARNGDGVGGRGDVESQGGRKRGFEGGVFAMDVEGVAEMRG